MNEILSRIYKVRKQKDITQKEICKAIDISESAFDNWKKGKNESYKKYLPQIAEILGVSVDYLIHGTVNEAEDFYARFKRLPERTKQIIELIMIDAEEKQK